MGLMITDLSGVVIEVNLAACHMHGYEYDQFIGRSVRTFLQSNNHANFDELIQTIKAGGRFHFIGKNSRSDGTPFDVEVYGTPLQYSGKSSILLIVLDLTDRKRMEREQARLISILEATPDYIGTADKHGNVLYINTGGRRLLGITKDEDVFFHQLSKFHPSWAWQIIKDKGFPTTLQKGIWKGETAIMHTDGHEIPVSQVIIGHYFQGGELEYLSTIMRDISEHKNEEIRQKKINQLLQVLSGTQAQFIADINPQSIFDQLLRSLLSLTQSKYGYLGEILYEEKGTPVLKMRAVTNISEVERHSKLWSQNAPNGLEFHNMKTLLDAVITSKRLIITNNLSSDSRGRGLHNDYPGLKAFMGIPFMRGDKLVGMAGIANRPGGYDKETAKFLQPFIITCGNIIEAYGADEKRRYAQKQLKKSLHEKEILIKEIHHRVKNNMQIISSMLRHQSSYLEDKHILSIFQDCQDRIRSMALIHEMLYQSEDLAEVEFSEYIRNLARILVRTYNTDTNCRVTPTIKADQTHLNINTAIPVGLITSELISNVLKHAFSDGRDGIMEVRFKVFPDNKFCLEVSDNGVGMEYVDWENPKSMGLRLVSLLTEQVKGQLEHQNQTGTKIKVTFHETKSKK